MTSPHARTSAVGTRPTAAPQIAAWFGVYVAWLVATRAYHPRASIAVAATAVLVGTSALAVYVDARRLAPRLLRRGRTGVYAAALLATIATLDLVAVGLIQLVYAALWHPDPLRFGFLYNVASDGAIIALHVAVARALARLLARR